MSFRATNLTVSIILIMCLTAFMAIIRNKKPFENNWLLFYWMFMTIVSFRYPDETFDPRFILIGLAAGLLLRFEFLGRGFGKLVMLVEACVWGYIFYRGFEIILI
jgi:hypothetical protein